MPHAAGGSSWLLTAVVGAIPLLVGWAYWVGVSRLRHRGVRWPPGRTAAAAAGLTACSIALVLPHGDFPVHVVSHLLLTMAGPLLLALGAPVTVALRTLGPRGRRSLLAVVHSSWLKVLTLPPVVLVLEVGGMYAFYLTPLFQAAHERPWLSVVLHLHMFLAGCLFSWFLVGRDPLPHRPSVPTALVVLLLAAVAHDVLAKLLVARGLPAGAGTVKELRWGAQIMFSGGTLVEIALAAALMGNWYRRTGRALHHAERRVGTRASLRAPLP